MLSWALLATGGYMSIAGCGNQDHQPTDPNGQYPMSSSADSPERNNNYSPERANNDSPERPNNNSPERPNNNSPERANKKSPERANNERSAKSNAHRSTPPSAQEIADALKLEGHIEGGFFRRTFQADHRAPVVTEKGERYLLTSIFYMLTAQSPVGHWHKNRSDIMHYYHLGDPVEYHLIHPDGSLEKVVLGSNVLAGQQLQLMVKGGIWKTSRLVEGPAQYGLISEAVAPGFDYDDMTLASASELTQAFPQHAEIIARFSKQ